jgi:hypothetical protein
MIESKFKMDSRVLGMLKYLSVVKIKAYLLGKFCGVDVFMASKAEIRNRPFS